MKFSQNLGLFSSLVLSFVASISTANTFKIVQVKEPNGQMAALYYNPHLVTETTRTNRLAPIGSVSLTSSGALAEQGIHSILHAASGSMGAFDESTEPTLDSVKRSIVNAIRLASLAKIKSLAIPLIGGGIFIDRMKTTREELAYNIIRAAKSAQSSIAITFIAYKDDEAESLRAAYAQNQSEMANLKWYENVIRWISNFGDASDKAFFANSKVVQGDITDFSVHGAEAIVNAANMELEFGGGISGAIGRKTQDIEGIDQTQRELIQQIYQDQSTDSGK